VIVDLDPDNDPPLLREVVLLCLSVLNGDDDTNTRVLATNLDRGPKHAADFVNMTAGLAVSALASRHAAAGDRAAMYQAHLLLVEMLEALEAMIGTSAG